MGCHSVILLPHLAKLGLASRWRSTARFRATSLFHKELAKSDQSINKFIYFVGENTGTPLFFSDSPVSREYQLVRSWRNCLAKYMGFFMPSWLFHHRSIYDYWKRQLTTGRDSKTFSWTSLLDGYTYCFCNHNSADSFGKGVGTLKWVALGLSRISSWAPKAGFLQTFEYSNAAHFFWLSDVKWITVTAGRTPQGWILSTPPLSLDNGLKQWSLHILFLKFCLIRGMILSSIRNFEALFSHCKLAQPACYFPARTSQSFLST